MVSCPLAECLKILRCMRGTRRLLHAVYPTGYTLPWISVHLLHLFTTIWFICWRNLYLGTVNYILVDFINWFILLPNKMASTSVNWQQFLLFQKRKKIFQFANVYRIGDRPSRWKIRYCIRHSKYRKEVFSKWYIR